MKQLKCIINDYSTNGNSGFININFNQNITLQPYSSLSLDKISMVILPNPSGIITIEADQTIVIVTQNKGTRPSPRRSVILPKGTYTYNETSPYVPNSQLNVYPDLVETLNKLFNGILIGTPLKSVVGNSCLDYGFGFRWVGAVNISTPPVYQLTLNAYQDKWNGGNAAAAPALTDLTGFDIEGVNAVASRNGYSSTVPGAFFIRDPTPIISGAVQCSVNIQLPQAPLSSVVNYGLCLTTVATETPVVEYGISFEGEYAYIINNKVRTTQLPIADFKGLDVTDTVNMYMYTDDTNGNLRFMVENPSGTQGYTTPVGTYTGYNTNIPYFSCVSGNNVAPDLQINFYAWRAFHQPSISVDNTGIFFTEPNNKLYLTNNSSYPSLGVVAPNRQIQIDFSSSQLLIKSLGLGVNIIQGNVIEGVAFKYTGPQGVDFVNYYDLGLDVLNLSLETYVGYSNGKNSSKRNALSYFLMQRISDIDSLFYAENKQMIFLSLENKQPMNISSLQFRIYDVNTGLPIALTNGSFNIFVSDRSDDGGHDRYPKTKYMGAVHDVAQF
jgi:hypothetical protein